MLVKPASIDTPFFQKARTYLGVEAQPVPPVYSPEVVSELILHAAALHIEVCQTWCKPGCTQLRSRAARDEFSESNFGQWRSDFRKTVAHCTSRSSPGRRVSQRLKPTVRDYFVLKPKHSGFFDTTLDTLLDALRIRRVILTGIAGNICVLFTANDAYMRELKSSPPPTASSRTRQPSTTMR